MQRMLYKHNSYDISPGLYCSDAALFKPMITPSINASITAPKGKQWKQHIP